MNHLMFGKGIHRKRGKYITNNESNEAVHSLAEGNKKTSFFFALPTSSFVRLVPGGPASKKKLEKAEESASILKPGDAVAAPRKCTEELNAEEFYLE